MTTPLSPPPGWEPDSVGEAGKRFWDGSTSHEAIPAAPLVAAPTSTNKPNKAVPVIAAIGVLLAAGYGVTSCGKTNNKIDYENWPTVPSDAPTPTVGLAPTATAPTSATKQSGCGTVGPTCDAVPKVDGIYKVSDGGTFSTGILPVWIQTAGPRPGEKICSWARLNGPSMTLEYVIDSGNTTSGPTKVHVQKGDVAFYSNGCQPWVKAR